jgi:hypothetical protein
LDLQVPHVSRFTMEFADLVSAQLIGTALAMAFRWWAFRRYVFPDADARPRLPAMAVGPPLAADADANPNGDVEPFGHP